ncbi:GNAT family N-acetyltransferase [Streptomyces sp. NPDC090025]|uniref:GNAT family N-acetyltransferase n=1 Tax=Streptomyces sp. NPDC090025 TaxID=3365922 RepID=UPI0038391571
MLIRTAPTHALGPDRLAAAHAMLDTAFDGSFAAEDWDHALGGVHAWAEDERGIAAHGSVVMRRVLHDGRSFRVGYVEAVGVRADLRRQGLGGRIMAALEPVVDATFAYGALSASEAGAALYAGRGWVRWPGRIETLGPTGPVRLPEDEGSVYLWRTPGRELPDPARARTLAFDWRDGDVM